MLRFIDFMKQLTKKKQKKKNQTLLRYYQFNSSLSNFTFSKGVCK